MRPDSWGFYALLLHLCLTACGSDPDDYAASAVSGLSLNADRPKNIVVVCPASTKDCSELIQQGIDAATASTQARTVMLQSGPGSRAEWPILRSIELKSSVHLSSDGQVVLQPSGRIAIVMFRVNGPATSKDISLSNLTIDLASDAVEKNIDPQTVLSVNGNYNRLSVSGVTVKGSDARRSFLVIDAAIGNFLKVEDNRVNHVMRFVIFKTGKHTNLELLKNDVRHLGNSAVSLSGTLSTILIKGNTFAQHIVGITTGHMIMTDGISPITNLKILANEVSGVANVSKVRSKVAGPDGTFPWIQNGASGDLIALRNVNGFEVANNLITHSGEVGLTISDGANQGNIHNNRILRSDAVAIVLGSGLRDFAPVTNINVHDNNLSNFGLDHSGHLKIRNGYHAVSGVRVWNAESVVIEKNDLLGASSLGSGVWVADFSKTVAKKVTVQNNTYKSTPVGKVVQAASSLQVPKQAGKDGGKYWTGKNLD